MSKNQSTPDIYLAALKILVRRPHAQEELVRKLKKKGYAADQIEQVIVRLQQEKYLDDAKLACELVEWHSKYRPLGRRGLFWRLKRKGFTTEHIEAALKKTWSPELELKMARQLTTRKPGTREQLIRFLQRRGFSDDVILTSLEDAKKLER